MMEIVPFKQHRLSPISWHMFTDTNGPTDDLQQVCTGKCWSSTPRLLSKVQVKVYLYLALGRAVVNIVSKKMCQIISDNRYNSTQHNLQVNNDNQ